MNVQIARLVIAVIVILSLTFVAVMAFHAFRDEQTRVRFQTPPPIQLPTLQHLEAAELLLNTPLPPPLQTAEIIHYTPPSRRDAPDQPPSDTPTPEPPPLQTAEILPPADDEPAPRFQTAEIITR